MSSFSCLTGVLETEGGLILIFGLCNRSSFWISKMCSMNFRICFSSVLLLSVPLFDFVIKSRLFIEKAKISEDSLEDDDEVLEKSQWLLRPLMPSKYQWAPWLTGIKTNSFS